MNQVKRSHFLRAMLAFGLTRGSLSVQAQAVDVIAAEAKLFTHLNPAPTVEIETASVSILGTSLLDQTFSA